MLRNVKLEKKKKKKKKKKASKKSDAVEEKESDENDESGDDSHERSGQLDSGSSGVCFYFCFDVARRLSNCVLV